MKTRNRFYLPALAALLVLGWAVAAPDRVLGAGDTKPLLISADSAAAVFSMAPMAPMR